MSCYNFNAIKKFVLIKTMGEQSIEICRRKVNVEGNNYIEK